MVLKGAETVADSRGKTSPCCVPGSHKFSSLEQMPLLSYCRDASLCFLRNFGFFSLQWSVGNRGREMLLGKVIEQKVCIWLQVTVGCCSFAALVINTDDGWEVAPVFRQLGAGGTGPHSCLLTPHPTGRAWEGFLSAPPRHTGARCACGGSWPPLPRSC